MKALYIGSFDPFTIGHYEVLKQAKEIFDDVIVVVANNPDKKRYFSATDSIYAVKQIHNKVYYSDKDVSDLVKEFNCDYIIRGLRNTSDYLYEEQLAQIYKELNPDLKIVYFRANNKISSTFVRELHKRKKDISKYIPYNVDLIKEQR